MGTFTRCGEALEWRGGHETVRVEPWGCNSLRVRGTVWQDIRDDLPSALLPPASAQADVEMSAGLARLTNGSIRAEISDAGRLLFLRALDDRELLAEVVPHFSAPAARRYSPAGGLHHFEVLFQAIKDERLYGLGQHQHGLLNQKGAVVDLVQRNTEVSIPFLVSSLGYGFLWNHPGIGRAELGVNTTRWVSEATRQWDYWITASDEPAELLRQYGDAVGRAPMLPEWASGFWQSKCRYRTQDELLDVAREYKRRGLPLSVIVIDFFHWTRHGNWEFDPAEWPDPAGMVSELSDLGVKLIVSIWPTANLSSRNYEEMNNLGFLVANEHGIPVHLRIWDKGPGGDSLVRFYDATNPQARSYLWEKVRKGYYNHGIRTWWLDACEPEALPEQPANMRYHLGPGLEVGNIYPLAHAQAFYDGMRQEGEQEILTLSRSAWAGSQRYGTVVWSGDIGPTFDDLRRQIPAGLNIGLSGIPWWTTDIGGFKGGDISSPSFRELMVRWFQFGVFTPICRLHGAREPFRTINGELTGAANEVWSFGDDVYQILRRLLFLRERLRPYVTQQMRIAHETGLPPMRPLFVDFPADETSWEVEDEFLFGGDLLVAPVTIEGARTRRVYLPAGAQWRDAWTGATCPGGNWVTAPAPLDTIPVYLREGGCLQPFGPLSSFGMVGE
jgi:alpha-D-xyloside xylohydrolase